MDKTTTFGITKDPDLGKTNLKKGMSIQFRLKKEKKKGEHLRKNRLRPLF
jgi:hypothetical protein